MVQTLAYPWGNVNSATALPPANIEISFYSSKKTRIKIRPPDYGEIAWETEMKSQAEVGRKEDIDQRTLSDFEYFDISVRAQKEDFISGYGLGSVVLILAIEIDTAFTGGLVKDVEIAPIPALEASQQPAVGLMRYRS